MHSISPQPFDRRHAKALAASVSLLALALVLYHSLAGGTLLGPNAYDSYLLQAQNWLAGSAAIQNGEQYPWLELAVFEGRYYLSFPPVPSVLALPFAALGLSVSNLCQAAYGLMGAAGVYLCFWQRGGRPQHCAYWALFATLGSGFFWLCCSGGVWFQAQVLNFCFAVWGILFWLRRQYLPAFFLLALTVGCRPFSALLAAALYLPVCIRQLKAKRFGRLLAVSALPLAVAAALAAYNAVRFGSIWEFGHNYLPEFMRETQGQFSAGYFWPNLLNLLRPVTLTAGLDLQFPLFNGFFFGLASPLFLLWGADLASAVRKKTFRPADGAVLLLFCVSLAALCFHRTLGGWQFGARYTVDLLPWALLYFLRRPPKALGTGAYWLCAAGALFNFYGAAYLLSH